MFKINSKSMGLFLLAAAVLAIGSGLFAQNQPDGQKEVRSKSPGAEKPKPTPMHTDRYGDPLPHGAVARLGSLRFRAPSEITDLAFAPDGKTIAVSSYAGFFLFETAGGKRISRLSRMNSTGGFLVFSPNSKRLAGMGTVTVKEGKGYRVQSAVQIWDLPGKGKPREFSIEHGIIWLGWSTDNEPLTVCVEKGGLRLYDLAAGSSRLFKCPNLGRRNPLCDFAPAGQALAVADEQNVVHVFDTAKGRQRCTLKPEMVAYIRSLALSPDGRTLACLFRDQARDREIVQLWDSTTGKALRTLASDQNYVSTIVFAPDGKTLATAGWSGIRFWDVTTGKERSRCEGPRSNTAKIAFSGDSQTVASAETYTGAVHLREVTTGKRKPEPPGHTGRPHGTFSPDGRHLFSAGGSDGTIHLWNTAAGNSLMQMHRDRSVRDIALSPDSRLLFSTWTDDNLWISDAATGEQKHVIKLEDPDRPDTRQSAISMHLSADGKTLVAFSYYYCSFKS